MTSGGKRKGSGRKAVPGLVKREIYVNSLDSRELALIKETRKAIRFLRANPLLFAKIEFIDCENFEE